MKKLFLLTAIGFSIFAHSQTTTIQNESKEARKRIMQLFNESKTPATLDDFTDALSSADARCITFPYNQDALSSHFIWFKKNNLVLAPPSPLFPEGSIQTTLQSSFKYSSVPVVTTPGENIITREATGLNLKTWGDVTIPREVFTQYMWMNYNFRKHQNFIVFSINFLSYLDSVIDTTKASYGYCW